MIQFSINEKSFKLTTSLKAKNSVAFKQKLLPKLLFIRKLLTYY